LGFNRSGFKLGWGFIILWTVTSKNYQRMELLFHNELLIEEMNLTFNIVLSNSFVNTFVKISVLIKDSIHSH